MKRAEAKTKVRQVIERLDRDGTVVASSDGSTHRLSPISIPTAEGEALSRWVTREEPAHTIEIGLGYAVSALYICEALLASTEGMHVAIDSNQSTSFAYCGLQLLDEAGMLGMVEFHEERSEITLPRLLDEGRSFDLAFVDGNHRFDGVFPDLVYLGRLLKPGGIVFLDDYQLPAISRAASFFASNLGWMIEEVSTPDDFHQWAVLRTSRDPDTRAFDYFVEF